MSGDEGYSLVMPFVACKSRGGPFDDEAFVAGFVCGTVDTVMQSVANHDATLTYWVSENLLPQLDLIAMKNNMVMAQQPTDLDTPYINVVFSRRPPSTEEEL